jgi:hypothetical protein
MFRLIAALLLSTALAFGASIKLYLKDGTYQLVREYQINGDRVRFYSVERSDWEEVPLSLVDLKRTESERQAEEAIVRKDAAELAAEDKFERQQREEIERVPQEPGLYMVDGAAMKTIELAESKIVNNKGRSVLKVLSPVPVVSGKSTVELDGEHSKNVFSNPRPEFYIRLADEDRFGIVRLQPKKGARIVQNWTIVPVTKEIVEDEKDVPIFRKQVDSNLYKIWPEQPLEPGEYAVVEYTEGKGNVRTWDFAYRKDR